MKKLEEFMQEGHDKWYGEPTHITDKGLWAPIRMINKDETINTEIQLNEIESFLTRLSQKGSTVTEWAYIMMERQDPQRKYVINRKILHFTGCEKEPEWTPDEIWMSYQCDGWTRHPMTKEEVQKLNLPLDRKCRSCRAILD